MQPPDALEVSVGVLPEVPTRLATALLHAVGASAGYFSHSDGRESGELW